MSHCLNITQFQVFIQNKTIQDAISSNKLLTSLKDHIKKSNRYNSNMRIDNSMPYEIKDYYKDITVDKQNCDSSLRSISDR